MVGPKLACRVLLGLLNLNMISGDNLNYSSKFADKALDKKGDFWKQLALTLINYSIIADKSLGKKGVFFWR